MTLLGLLRREKASPPAGLTLQLDGQSRPVLLRRSAQARRFTLRVRSGTGEIVLTMPAWARIADARAFAQRHAGWVEARLQQSGQRVELAAGAVVPLRGVPHRVVHRERDRGVVWAACREDGAAELHVAGRAEHVERRLAAYLRAEARRDLEAAVARCTARLGRPARRVVIRDQVSRWGSCSADGVLSFSWRLVLAPPYVLDYLAAHEAAHLVEMNHGPRFWQTVRGLDPEMDRAKAWIRQHGASLHAVGPPAGGKG